MIGIIIELADSPVGSCLPVRIGGAHEVAFFFKFFIANLFSDRSSLKAFLDVILNRVAAGVFF